ncbi:MAG: cysteine desulfurase-like protein [Sphingomonadaceae bacterium]|nr:cysteine desulfurase-like protein [Sphingomonadaceae bacterium]
MFDVEAVRAQFPALEISDGGYARVYLDAPGGTQVCERAVERMCAYIRSGTANDGGAFATSIATDRLSTEAHARVAAFLGAADGEVAFGPNMTSLTFALSRSLATRFGPADEIVVTRLDHDANVAPWLRIAEDRGLTVRWIDFDPDTGRLRLDTLGDVLSERTALVAVGHASNALGTINDVAAIAAAAKNANPAALVYVDAVQSVPHLPVDVTALGCDLLVASPYKFFGPHQGVMWGREALLEELPAYKVRPSPNEPPARKWETGTPSYEGQAGTLGAIEHIEAFGGMAALAAYERGLGQRLLDGLLAIPGLWLWGPDTMEDRVPTFAFTLNGIEPRAVAERLAAENIFVWSGSFYAVEVVERLGLSNSGGLVRVGLCHYNSGEEVDRVLDAIERIATEGR